MRLPTRTESTYLLGQSVANDPIASTPHSPNDENQIGAAPDDTSKQTNEYFELVARATNDSVRDWDVKTGHLFWPTGLFTSFGYDPAQTGNEVSFWQKNLHPDDRSRVAPAIRDALTGDSDHWSGEYRFRRADGSYAHLLERALILRDDSGAAGRFIGVMLDITTRKQLQDQLCRSQKMEAFGQLASGVGHDFNNFLTTILGYGDLLLHDPKLKGQAADHILEIRKAAGRASALTQQLLAFSRKQALEARVVEVNSIITKLERSLLPLLGENINVVTHLHNEKNPAHIQVDPDQLAQIILNLAVNARDAMPTGGRLTLQTGLLTITEQHQTVLGIDNLPPGEYVSICIIDTGCGMSDEAKGHLFEPFFTTKDHRSGLGLATSYGIIRQSGGQIQIESNEGKGTTVKILFRKVPPPPVSYKKPGNKKVRGGNESVLVLEDDVSVRHISVRVLRKLGYKVIEAANSDDAQRLIRENVDHQIDLLLTDMVMPQMSGRDFAKWLHQTSPRTKVLFVSGYLEESLHPEHRRDPDMFFLPKPFDQEQLALKVREALDS
jgi:PAS domain S-box-containing protein